MMKLSFYFTLFALLTTTIATTSPTEILHDATSEIDALDAEWHSNYDMDPLFAFIASIMNNISVLANDQQSSTVFISGNIAELIAALIEGTLDGIKKSTATRYTDLRKIMQAKRKERINPENDHSTEIILHTFANIVGSFANIVMDPYNVDTVGDNVRDMLHGVVNIAVQGTRSGDHTGSARVTEIVSCLENDKSFMRTIIALLRQGVHTRA